MELKLMILFDENNHEEAQLLDLIIEYNSKQSKSEIELSSERRDIGILQIVIDQGGISNSPFNQWAAFEIFFIKLLTDNILKINLNTMYLVGLASIVLVFISLFINYGSRISKSKILNYLTNFSISGYAIPGVILAVAFITLFSNLSELIGENTNLGSTKKFFIGSIFGLMLAYFIRFFSLSFNGIKSSYEKINNSLKKNKNIFFLYFPLIIRFFILMEWVRVRDFQFL